MKAVVYHEFGGSIGIEPLPDPSPEPDGAVIQIEATGLCRSDWHGWHGRDPDIKRLPHVPGHEFAGTVVAVGRDVRRKLIGERVTMPFVAGCGACQPCQRGDQQLCDFQFQPGFTAWGSFADYVAVRYADENLVPLPENISSIAAAALGCRLATAYRAVAAQGAVKTGEWVAVHGCGGVGLSAVTVAHALGARVIAVDMRSEPLQLARRLGAETVLNSKEISDIPAAIHEISSGGADISLDAAGTLQTLANSIRCLRKGGRHVQIGYLTEKDSLPAALLSRVIAWEIAILGSHGLQAHAYPTLLDLIQSGRLDPTILVERTAPLEEAPRALALLDEYRGCGITVFTPNA